MHNIRTIDHGSIDDEHALLERRIRSACDTADYAAAATLALEGFACEIRRFLSSRLRSSIGGQEAFSMFAEDLWAGLSRFEWRCSIRSWAYVLARNAAHRYLRSLRRGVSLTLTLSSGMWSVVDEDLESAMHSYRRSAVLDRLNDLLERLEPDEQMLLILRVDREMRWREIAVAMGGDAHLAGSALAREEARLRKSFERVKVKLKRLVEEAGLLD